MPRNTDAPTLVADAPDGAAPATDDSRQIATLTGQLREKDQLVTALTERLEQAAEQLDRLRRTGVDKGRRPLAATGSAAPDWLHEHRPTFDDLKRVLANWDEIQPGQTFVRIETQLAGLHDLLAGAAAAHPAAGSGRANANGERPGAPANAPAPKSAGNAPPNSWWEKQKAALMGDAPASVESPEGELSSAAAEAARQPAAEHDAAAASIASINLSETAIPDLPPPIDFDNLTLDEARGAIRVRDAIILALREPLLLAQAAGQLPRDLASLEQLPDAARKRLEEIETQWQAKFRQVELELALERARLGREQAQLQHQQELLQKQQKQRGQSLRENAEAGEGDDKGSRRRWFRFMGKPGGEESPDTDGG
ncbi:MAG: hypothetical protein ACT4QC_21665 [Planctomycetaceae bacterium]